MSSRLKTLSTSSLILALALTGCTSEEPPSPAAGGGASPAGDAAPSSAPVTDPAASLSIKDQTSQGPTVLAKASATKGGFVVVYGDDGRNTLGTGLVPPGTEPQDVQISLAEEPTERIELMARLFADTDGNGIYNAGDQPLGDGEDDDSDDAEAFPGEQETFSFQGKKVVNS